MAVTSEFPFRNHPFNKRLRELRMARGWSQRALADRAGINETDLAYWETGRRVPQQGRTRDKAVRVAGVLCDDPAELMALIDPDYDGTVDVRPSMVEFIMTDPDLTWQNKATLVSVFEGLVAAQEAARSAESSPNAVNT